MTDLDQRMTRAFADLFAANRARFRDGAVRGGPGYYGVHAIPAAPDGSVVDVVLTFRAGERYCCMEPGCHAAFYDTGWWARLRAALDRHGLGHLPLPTVRRFRGVVEPAAVFQPGLTGAPDACLVVDGSEYEVGPWEPVLGVAAGRGDGKP